MKYKISELAEKADVTKRTIHYYISKGLLQPSSGSGVNSIYTEEHLNRILLIKKLQSNYMPLDKIRDYIFNNPNEKILEEPISKKGKISKDKSNIYYRENIMDIFEIHCTSENSEKYKYILENVRKYIIKMLEE